MFGLPVSPFVTPSPDSYLRAVLSRYEIVSRGPLLQQVALDIRRVIEPWAGTYLVDVRPTGSCMKGTAVMGQTDLDLFVSIRSDVRGFSTSSLAYMRSFFLLYQDRAKILQSAIGKSGVEKNLQSAIGRSALAQRRPFTLSWTHYIFLLGIKNPDERSFYEIEAASQDWTVRELKRQFDTSLYERLALSRDKKGIRRLARKGHIISQPKDLFKEPLVLEFLGLDEQARYSESETRAEPAGFAGSGASWEGMGTLPGFPSTNDGAIISQIERFLLEMGKGFLFEARQKRFSFDDDHFFVDLGFPKRPNIHAREYQLYLPSKEELQKKLVEWAGKAADARKC
jgi:predicted nuclease of restriction endonuclease-like (RecB) superfamily